VIEETAPAKEESVSPGGRLSKRKPRSDGELNSMITKEKNEHPLLKKSGEIKRFVDLDK